MFISPPRTSIFRLPRLVLFSSLIGALNSPPSQGADPLPPTKLEMSIPPGMDDLESLQADYEKSSKELEGHLVSVQKNASSCPNGAIMAKLLEKAGLAQAHQRKKIVDSLSLSKLELQTEVAKLDGIGAEMKQNASGSTVIEASKGLIAAGAAKPLGVIAEEQKKIKTHNERKQGSIAGAAAALEGEAPRCKEARNTYFEKMRPLALKIPEKLSKVEISLSAHKKALDSWADSIGNSLVGRGGSVSASASAATPSF